MFSLFESLLQPCGWMSLVGAGSTPNLVLSRQWDGVLILVQPIGDWRILSSASLWPREPACGASGAAGEFDFRQWYLRC